MKKILLTFVLLVLFINSYSQKNSFDLGIKVGLNFTIPSTSENGSADFSAKSGLNIGIFSNFRLSEKLYLKPELSISTENINYNIQHYDIQEKGANKETYLNIPILVKFYLNNKINFEIGPQIGFIINNNAILVIDDGANFIIGDDAYFKDKPKDKFSGNVGVIYDITEDLNFGIRYNFGISEINGFKNSTLSLNFSYNII